MNVVLNGEPRGLETGCSLVDLIDQLELTGKRLAIELNREIVPRSRFEDTVIRDGDVIEIVNAIGGG